MGWLKHRSEHRDSEAEAAALDGREHEAERLEALLETARVFRGYTADELPEGVEFVLHHDERVFGVFTNALLVEPRSSGGRWVGRSQGVSIRVPGTRSMRYRVGQAKGHYVRDEDRPTPIDTGVAVITDHRVVFTGPKQNREWAWTKVVSVHHDPDAPWTAIAVSNRQKVSGLGYDVDHAEDFRFRVDLALAVANDTADHLIRELEQELGPLRLPPPDPSAIRPGGTDADTPAPRAGAADPS